MGFLVFIVVVIIITVIIVTPITIFSSIKDKKNKDNALENYINFISKKGLISCQSVALNNIAKIDIDTTKKLLGVYSYYESESIILRFEEILDFEVIENGNSVVSSRTGSAVAGGLLF